MAALDLEAEDAAPRDDAGEVDLALLLAAVVGDVEGVEDGPTGGVGAGGPDTLRRVRGETLEDELLAVARRVRRDGGRDQAHVVPLALPGITSPRAFTTTLSAS